MQIYSSNYAVGCVLISAWVRGWAQTPTVQSNFEGKKRRKSSTKQVWNSPRRVKNIDTVNERRISKCWQKVCLLFLTFFKSLLQLLNLFKYSFCPRICHWVDKCGSSVIKKNLTQYVFCYKTEMYVWLWVKYGDYEYATINSVEWFLMILAEPRIFGVCCNVWPDLNWQHNQTGFFSVRSKWSYIAKSCCSGNRQKMKKFAKMNIRFQLVRNIKTIK